MGSQELSKYNVGVTLDCEIFANFDDVANKTNTTRETLRTCYVYIQTFSTFPSRLETLHSYINKNSSNLGKIKLWKFEFVLISRKNNEF